MKLVGFVLLITLSACSNSEDKKSNSVVELSEKNSVIEEKEKRTEESGVIQKFEFGPDNYTIVLKSDDGFSINVIVNQKDLTTKGFNAQEGDSIWVEGRVLTGNELFIIAEKLEKR